MPDNVKNVVIVTGQSTTTKQPDASSLKLAIFSKKSSSAEATQSVQRRLDYVLQVLRLHNFNKHKIIHKTRLEENKRRDLDILKIDGFEEHLRPRKISGGSFSSISGTEYQCTCDISAQLDGNGGKLSPSEVNQRIWDAHNVLVDKIGGKNTDSSSVTIYPPTEMHTQTAIAQEISNTGKLAIENGKLKALQWCETLDSRLGTCVKVIELESSREHLGKQADHDPIQLCCKVELTFTINPE